MIFDPKSTLDGHIFIYLFMLYLVCYTLSGPERASYKRYIDDFKTGLIYTIRSIRLSYFQGPPGCPGYFYNQNTI